MLDTLVDTSHVLSRHDNYVRHSCCLGGTRASQPGFSGGGKDANETNVHVKHRERTPDTNISPTVGDLQDQ